MSQTAKPLRKSSNSTNRFVVVLVVVVEVAVVEPHIPGIVIVGSVLTRRPVFVKSYRETGGFAIFPENRCRHDTLFSHTAGKEHYQNTTLFFDCGDFTLLRKKHISLHNTLALWILDTKIVTEKFPVVTITEI